MNLPVGLLARFGQGLDKVVPIHVIQEDVLTLVSTAHDVINRAGVLHSDFARRGESIARIGKQVEGKEAAFLGLTPFPAFEAVGGGAL